MAWTKENRKKYYHLNKKKFFIYMKSYREKHKKEIRERNRKYRENNWEKVKEQNRLWRLKNLESVKRKAREYYTQVKKPNRINENKRIRELRRKQKEIILKHYGNKCSCCGETQIEFLTIDHINNDGAKHRKEIGGSAKVYPWIVKNNFPKDFQVLCFNCNLSKGIYGKCPHKKLLTPQPAHQHP